MLLAQSSLPSFSCGQPLALKQLKNLNTSLFVKGQTNSFPFPNLANNEQALTYLGYNMNMVTED